MTAEKRRSRREMAQYLPTPELTSAPFSEDSERLILGALLSGWTNWEEAKTMTEEEFFLASHKRIFSYLRSRLQRGAPVDLLLAIQAFTRTKELDAIGGPAYLASLNEGIPHNCSIGAHVRLLKDYAALRKIHAAAYAALEACSLGEEPLVVIAALREALDACSVDPSDGQ